jgi:hypothetical protein
MARRVCVLLLLLGMTGCQFGRFALSLNRDRALPLPEVNVLPDQWEPEIVEP